jgi:alpha-glucosidase (family GH31 glycosyl hydrolase)
LSTPFWLFAKFYHQNFFDLEVANLYPLLNQKAFEEGMHSAGEDDFVTLSRSGWAGCQRFKSVVWSGDIASTFEALQSQVRADLNMPRYCMAASASARFTSRLEPIGMMPGAASGI